MESWTEFVIARYNYWIVIVLMMIGLYTVFARGNLVKKIVGLNIFQTSVFIFYITMGKIAGGTAPIYIGDELEHGGGHGEAGHEAEAEHAADQAAEAGASLHAKVENSLQANDLKAAANEFRLDEGAIAGEGGHDAAALHSAPDSAAKLANEQLADIGKSAGDGIEFTIDAAHAAAEAAAYNSEVIYTNPVPHVLILTAIVVGVAGTAVGLALAVRIREAYGTIEEDELEAMDDVAEFGGGAESPGAPA